MEQLHGTVKIFIAEKGYGFIRADDGKEFFIHQSQINMNGYRMLLQGESVLFDVELLQDGRTQAVNVNRIQEA